MRGRAARWAARVLSPVARLCRGTGILYSGPGRGERFGIFPLPGRFFRPFLAGTRKGPAGGMPADRTAQSRRRHADAANSAAPSTIDTEWEYGSFDSIDVPLRMTAPGGWRRRVAHTVRRYRRGGCLSTRIRRLRLPVPSRIYCVPNFFDTLRAAIGRPLLFASGKLPSFRMPGRSP